MAAENCFGIVMVAMLLPSLQMERFKHKAYAWWTIAGVVFGTIAGVWGWQNYLYKAQWMIGVLSVVIWGYLIIYLIRERKNLEVGKRMRQPFFWCLAIMFLFMVFSVHEGLAPLWMLLVFGGYYLIGIPKENREDFFQGMLNGIILWFFVQQIVAYGLRPYDYVRYRGMYSGETQNGVFYMIVYCAFLCKWIWAKNTGKNRLWVWLYFFLSAGSISFLLFTGGRSSLMGAAVATLAIYTINDIIWKKSFYKWLLHIAVFGICVLITFPLVYGTIRYLPTILHHPIWFEGEYNEQTSVRSFDSWDSDRYISFEEAIDNNIGRILSLLGIDIQEIKGVNVGDIGALKVYAAEQSEPGSSPENPFALPDTDRYDPVSLRKTIAAYYLYHVNLRGHSVEDSGFYTTHNYYAYHAHNMLIQMAYDYGFPVGILFLFFTVYSLIYLGIRAFKGKEDNRWICFAFFVAVFFYGMTEMAVNPATITWILMYLIFYFVGEDSKVIERK